MIRLLTAVADLGTMGHQGRRLSYLISDLSPQSPGSSDMSAYLSHARMRLLMERGIDEGRIVYDRGVLVFGDNVYC